MFAIEKQTKPNTVGRGNRLVVKGFKYEDQMHKFLCDGDNGCTWRESDRGLRPGTYAFAGGRWHNVKNLDPVLLAHI